ncbi:MAG: C1 family peptidase [Betaproteobacteria bacterium]|nr:C1 family peptidase [Betaproteobacteria bacterium]
MATRSTHRKSPVSTPRPRKVVLPDPLDLRDRAFIPQVAAAPKEVLWPDCKALPVLHQGETSACTGFALSNVVNYLLWKSHRRTLMPVPPFMLYSMARRYDEFPGSTQDAGSSLRGAMKGWFKHGACSARLWQGLTMPPAKDDAAEDWWQDAVNRPLGAYYRINTQAIADMHAALNEVGILYASAVCHSGWEAGFRARAGDDIWSIEPREAALEDGGHAFAIVGYDQQGFFILNSWGSTWGSGGYARLRYEDWMRNAMDCWVAQLGVVTDQHREIARARSLRLDGRGQVRLSQEKTLRNREISPFVIDVENNGRLSQSGDFRTSPGDLAALLGLHMESAMQAWGIRDGDEVDIAIYARGGLTSEEDAAVTAAKWIPALYDARIFPIFIMWETGAMQTLRNMIEDATRGAPRQTAGIGETIARWWNTRLERVLSRAGTAFWGEMKENADLLSSAADSGGIALYQAAQESAVLKRVKPRLHLIGHSAGSIVHGHMIDRLVKRGWRFKSVNFMAPAISVEDFNALVLPAVKSGAVERFNEFHLSDEAELKDPTCGPYRRSLLYLVSESFEHGRRTPILGMEKYFDAAVGSLKLPSVKVWTAPTGTTTSTTHGGFDDDINTMRTVIRIIGR